MIAFPTLAFPALAMVSAFGLVLAVPRGSAASRIVKDLERHTGGVQSKTVADRFVDARKLERLQARFAVAGWYQTTPVAFLTRCAIFAGAGALAAVATAWMLHFNLMMAAGALGVFTFAGGHLPFSQLNGAAKKRAREISRALPDLLDTLSSTVRAGLALNAALVHGANAVQGALADEIRVTLSDIRLGRSRADSLRALATRVENEEIGLMVRAMVQAERLGANLSAVLNGLSLESRERRVLKAEEIAASLPVKMVLPMALFMLPALFIMIFGAVAADYLSR